MMIHTDRTIEGIFLPRDHTERSEKLHVLLGGSTESVPIQRSDGSVGVAYMTFDAQFKRFRPNEIATLFIGNGLRTGSFVAGTMVVTGHGEAGAESIPQHLRSEIEVIARTINSYQRGIREVGL
jgi:hypothetical protein